jgi:hypothetical protein
MGIASVLEKYAARRLIDVFLVDPIGCMSRIERAIAA